jgi:predicted polyphosphate/ATP-dependent NAD kinase
VGLHVAQVQEEVQGQGLSLHGSARPDVPGGPAGRKRLGLIVNPVAGVGGRVGLKGSDGADVVRAALERGAARDAPLRARLALERLARLRAHIEVLTWPGEMGEDEARAAGFDPRVLGSFAGRRTYVTCELERVPGEPPALRCDDFVFTTAGDTEAAARDLLAAGVDLILFAGGDGTARAVCAVVGDAVPVIGVPAGVKIHSAVYATTPAAAGDLAALYLHDRPAGVRLREGEVMDIDEEAFRQDRVSAHLYGFMTVPYARGLTQSAKAGGVAGEERALNDVAEDVVQGMDPEALYVLGPGTTTRTIMERLGLPKTLLGVDTVRRRRLAGADVTEAELLALLDATPEAHIVVTVIGGQGHIFGRGNQQISPAVIRRVGAANIIVVATQTKLLSLEGRPLLVDSGDPELDEELCGYVKVVTGLGERTMYKVGA